MSGNYLHKLKQINTFIFDIDGVLTDGSITLMPNGEQIRKMNIKDGYALQLAIKKGYQIGIISGGKSEAAKKRLEGLGIQHIYLGVSDKVDVFKEFCLTFDILPEHTVYMGDDIPDYGVMKLVGIAACPNNAAQEIQAISNFISPMNGGEGCVRDIIEKVMKIKGDWFSTEKSEKEYSW
jgi:3-deoxy-D-manno-octulosonate 8-phosphate phosphatase (KDO 8-P phosphatase)